MPDPADDFGAGIPVPAGQQQQPPVVETPADPWSQIRSQFDGIPEDLKIEDFANHYTQVQAKAAEADQLRQQLAEFEAQRAAALAGKPPVTPEAPAVEEDPLPWEPVKLDRALLALVAYDEKSGMYAPTDRTSVAHINAAETANKRLAYQQQLQNAWYDDPRAVTEMLTKKQLAAFKKEMSEQFETFKKDLAPVQQHVAQTTEERTIQAFINTNREKLFVADESGNEVLTPLGELVDEYMAPDKAGDPPKMPIEQAYAMAEKAAKRFAPPPTPAPQQPVTPLRTPSISKRQAQPPEGRNRFIDHLTPPTRQLAELPDSGETNGKVHATERDFRKKYGLLGNG